MRWPWSRKVKPGDDVIDQLRELVRDQRALAEENMRAVQRRRRELDTKDEGPCDG